MHVVDQMDQSVDLGTVSDDIIVDGMNAGVSAFIPTKEHVTVEVDGMNAVADLSGHGAVSLKLDGMNAQASIDDSLDLIEQDINGMNAGITRREPDGYKKDQRKEQPARDNVKSEPSIDVTTNEYGEIVDNRPSNQDEN